MDKKFIMLTVLIEDAMMETRRINEYIEMIDIINKDTPDKADEARKKLAKMRCPSRERIKDALRMARRITLDIERSL